MTETDIDTKLFLFWKWHNLMLSHVSVS